MAITTQPIDSSQIYRTVTHVKNGPAATFTDTINTAFDQQASKANGTVGDHINSLITDATNIDNRTTALEAKVGSSEGETRTLSERVGALETNFDDTNMPVADSASGAAGIATTFAHSDHSHILNVDDTVTPVNVSTTAASVGVDTHYARADHKHSAAVATTSADGFMASTDKTKLEFVNSKRMYFQDTLENPYTKTWEAITDETDPYYIANYRYKITIPLTADVTANDYPEVIFSVTDAVSGNFAPVVESYGDGVSVGGIYLWAKESQTLLIPTYIIIKQYPSA